MFSRKPKKSWSERKIIFIKPAKKFANGAGSILFDTPNYFYLMTVCTLLVSLLCMWANAYFAAGISAGSAILQIVLLGFRAKMVQEVLDLYKMERKLAQALGKLGRNSGDATELMQAYARIGQLEDQLDETQQELNRTLEYFYGDKIRVEAGEKYGNKR